MDPADAADGFKRLFGVFSNHKPLPTHKDSVERKLDTQTWHITCGCRAFTMLPLRGFHKFKALMRLARNCNAFNRLSQRTTSYALHKELAFGITSMKQVLSRLLSVPYEGGNSTNKVAQKCHMPVQPSLVYWP